MLYGFTIFTKFCSSGSNWQKVNTGFGDNLVVNSLQAFTGATDDPCGWHIYASLDVVVVDFTI